MALVGLGLELVVVAMAVWLGLVVVPVVVGRLAAARLRHLAITAK